LTLFKSETVKAEFVCDANILENGTYAHTDVTDDREREVASIQVTVTNPYTEDLIVYFEVDFQIVLEDQDYSGGFFVLNPGKTVTIGAIGRETREFDDDDTFKVDNNSEDGVVYLSDGSYFSLFGSQTIFVLGSSYQAQSNYDCIVSGPFIGITNYKHELGVTKNAKMVENLHMNYKYNTNSFSFEKQLEKYAIKYEDALQKNGAENFVNHYFGSSFGPYVFEAKGKYGDTLTLFKSETVKAEFVCDANILENGTYAHTDVTDDREREVASIQVTVTNPYTEDLIVYFEVDFQIVLEDQDYSGGFFVLNPGKTVTIGAIGRETREFDDDDTFKVDNNSEDGVVYLSDGSYFSLFGSQTIFAIGDTNQTLSNYDCIVSGPYIARLPYGDVLQNTYRGPPNDEIVFKTNKLLSKMRTKNKDVKKSLGKLAKKSFVNKMWK